ncbi:hypothetical protein AB0I22_38965 [Streptomyces sp. NPDC050610]|uniref:hypothetical protein n=1 Tax=Streptomyces sp. NPDC050610 TaxID=3157097 RepID=UPI0034476DCD
MHSTSTTSRITITVADPDTAIPLAQVTVAADDPAVAGQCRRYVARRWHVDPAPRPPAEDQVPVISAAVNPGEVHTIEQAVVDHQHEELRYGGVRALRMHDTDGRAYAVQMTRSLAYLAEPDRRHLAVVAMHRDALGLATVRLARDAIRAQLQAEKWALLRGAAVVRDGKALLIAGAPGVGTTTAVLHLCCAGWRLISDGRLFARPAPGGGVHLLPWPAPIAAGLPTLDSLGLYERARQDYIDVTQPHPDQPYEINRALRQGTRGPVVDWQGLVRQAMVFPAQIGLTTAAGGTAAAVLHLHASSGTPEPAAETDAVLGDAPFTGPDRYPDLLGLTAGTPPQATAVRAARDALAPLPQCSVRLGHHDPRETARVLAQTADTLILGRSVAAGPR